MYTSEKHSRVHLQDTSTSRITPTFVCLQPQDACTQYVHINPHLPTWVPQTSLLLGIQSKDHSGNGSQDQADLQCPIHPAGQDSEWPFQKDMENPVLGLLDGTALPKGGHLSPCFHIHLHHPTPNATGLECPERGTGKGPRSSNWNSGVRGGQAGLTLAYGRVRVCACMSEYVYTCTLACECEYI